MSYLTVFILAIIQAAAELLPVSSSAHVILMQHWLGLDPSSAEMVFLLVMLHTGTMFSVLFFFRHRWKKLFSEGGKVLIKKLVLATGATGVLGVALKKLVEKVILGGDHAEVEDLFRSRPAVAAALFAAGTLIFLSGIYRKRVQNAVERPLDFMSAGLIGLVQGLCLPFRGFSRSGATISTALFLGINKDLAEDFSFMLAVIVTPPVIARSGWKLYKATLAQGADLSTVIQQTIVPGLTGAVIAMFAGIVALKLLSKMLETNRWWIFGIYCYIISAVMISGI